LWVYSGSCAEDAVIQGCFFYTNLNVAFVVPTDVSPRKTPAQVAQGLALSSRSGCLIAATQETRSPITNSCSCSPKPATNWVVRCDLALPKKNFGERSRADHSLPSLPTNHVNLQLLCPVRLLTAAALKNSITTVQVTFASQSDRSTWAVAAPPQFNKLVS